MVANNSEALVWCREHDLRVSFKDDQVFITVSSIREEDQRPVVADNFVNAVNKVIVTMDEL